MVFTHLQRVVKDVGEEALILPQSCSAPAPPVSQLFDMKFSQIYFTHRKTHTSTKPLLGKLNFKIMHGFPARLQISALNSSNTGNVEVACVHPTTKILKRT